MDNYDAYKGEKAGHFLRYTMFFINYIVYISQEKMKMALILSAPLAL